MKAQMKVKAGLIVEAEAETQKDLFKLYVQTNEVFGEKQCGLCGSEDIWPAWRVSKKVLSKTKTTDCDYPEWRCKCGGYLSISMNLEGGGLFPNRKLMPNGAPATGENRDKGEYGDHNGWTKFRGVKEEK